VTTVGFKYDSVIKTPESTREYTFEISAPGLAASHLEEVNAVSFVDAVSSEMFHLTQPFMEDALGKRSHNVGVTVTQAENGRVFVTFIHDGAYGRVYCSEGVAGLILTWLGLQVMVGIVAGLTAVPLLPVHFVSQWTIHNVSGLPERVSK
jgi:hypothetical protein